MYIPFNKYEPTLSTRWASMIIVKPTSKEAAGAASQIAAKRKKMLHAVIVIVCDSVSVSVDVVVVPPERRFLGRLRALPAGRELGAATAAATETETQSAAVVVF